MAHVLACNLTHEKNSKVERDSDLMFDDERRVFFIEDTSFYTTGYGSDPAPTVTDISMERVRTLLRDRPDDFAKAEQLASQT